jgi:hypothetical protein
LIQPTLVLAVQVHVWEEAVTGQLPDPAVAGKAGGTEAPIE